MDALGEQRGPNLPSMGASTADPLIAVHRRLELFSIIRPDFKDAKLTWTGSDTRDPSLDRLATKNWSAIQRKYPFLCVEYRYLTANSPALQYSSI
jgi:hypothetical protein